MGFSDRGLQLLNVILENQRRRNEPAEQRGHELNLMSIQNQQRNLESDIERSRQRQDRIADLSMNIGAQLDSLGVDTSSFDDASKDLIERTGNSLMSRFEHEEEILRMKEEKLAGLRSAQAFVHQGRQFGQSLEPEFEPIWDGDRLQGVQMVGGTPYASLVDTLNTSPAEFEREVMRYGQFDSDITPTQASAFIAGTREVLSDREERRAAREQAFNESFALWQGGMEERRTRAQERQFALEEIESRTRTSSWLRNEVQEFGAIASGMITSTISPFIANLMALTSIPEKSRSDRKAVKEATEQVAQTAHSGVTSIGNGLYNMILEHAGFSGDVEVDPEDSAVASQIGGAETFSRNFAESFQNQFVKLSDALVFNQSHAEEMIVGALESFSKAYEASLQGLQPGENAIMRGLRDGIISEREIANLMAFTHNPLIFDGYGIQGSQFLRDLSDPLSKKKAYSEGSPINIERTIEKAWESNEHTQRYNNAISAIQSMFGEMQSAGPVSFSPIGEEDRGSSIEGLDEIRGRRAEESEAERERIRGLRSDVASLNRQRAAIISELLQTPNQEDREKLHEILKQIRKKTEDTQEIRRGFEITPEGRVLDRPIQRTRMTEEDWEEFNAVLEEYNLNRRR